MYVSDVCGFNFVWIIDDNFCFVVFSVNYMICYDRVGICWVIFEDEY